MKGEDFKYKDGNGVTRTIRTAKPCERCGKHYTSWCGACRTVMQSEPMPPSTEEVLRQRAAAKAAGGAP